LPDKCIDTVLPEAILQTKLDLTCAPSTFDWHYDEKEVCYILEGKVTVKTADETVNFGPGDLVTFPAGLDCVWTVHERVRKHYRLG